MAEWLTNLTAFRDVLLLLTNIGILAALIGIAGLLSLRHRQARAAEQRLTSRLEQLTDRLGDQQATPLEGFKTTRTGAGNPTPTMDWAPLANLLTANRDALRSLADRLAAHPATAIDPDLRKLVEQQHTSLRGLLEEWTTENNRRTQASEQLRDAIREDIRAQADRLREIVAETRPEKMPAPHPTAGTITASPTGEDDAWRAELRQELDLIVDKLNRMSERMDEIFRI